MPSKKGDLPRLVGTVEKNMGLDRDKSKPFLCPPYEPMVDHIPEMKDLGFEVVHFEMTEEGVKKARLMSYISFSPGDVRWLEPGRYVHLNMVGKWIDTIMSDTPMERMTNLHVIEYAHGDVLLAGLGIGMILIPLCNKPEVQTVTVIEKELGIMHMIWPNVNHPKASLVHADIFEWTPPIHALYDIIYFDIWNDICGDNYLETKTLHKRFGKYRRPGGWIGSWRRADQRKQHTGKWRDDTFEGWRAL